jgi:AcrR family transcriptional regulator
VTTRHLRRDALANQERVLAAAAVAVLRDGPQVPMATIAADADVGVGTLYRRYPTRAALLAALSHRAFLIIRDYAVEATGRDETAIASLEWYLHQVIGRRGELVLPLHGGPAVLAPETAAVRDEVHAALRSILERGRRDRSIRPDATTADVIVTGAMLAQPLAGVPDWDRTARRLLGLFLDGLSIPARSSMG